LQAVEQRFLIGTGMTPAGDDAQRGGRGAAVNRLGRLVTLLAPATQPGAAPVEGVPGRHADNAEAHLAVLDQGDVDGEFLRAGNEFLGAIQRVDQPETLPMPALVE